VIGWAQTSKLGAGGAGEGRSSVAGKIKAFRENQGIGQAGLQALRSFSMGTLEDLLAPSAVLPEDLRPEPGMAIEVLSRDDG